MGMDGVDGVVERRIEANGLRFQVATCEPQGAANDAGLALCLHGFPECWYSWRHQMPLLARRGWRVWAPHLRGYGQTDRPTRVADYAIEKLLDDVAGLIDASGARRVLLLGHDWGAVIAWFFAMRRLRELERLVIMNVPHPGCFKLSLRRPRQILMSWYVFFFQIPWLPERLMSPERVGRALRQTAVHKDRFDAEDQAVYARYAAIPGARTAMLNYYRALLRGGGARQARLGFPTIETPTLMVWGEQDTALAVENTEGTGDYVRDLTLRRLPDASHWVQQDAPETVNAMLEAWLDGAPVPEASRVASAPDAPR